MQEAANMPLVLMCHEDARKHASIVYQFHNIYLLLDGVFMSEEKSQVKTYRNLALCRVASSHGH